MLRWSSTKRRDYYYTPCGRMKYEGFDGFQDERSMKPIRGMLNFYEENPSVSNISHLESNRLNNRRHSYFPTGSISNDDETKRFSGRNGGASRLSISFSFSTSKTTTERVKGGGIDLSVHPLAEKGDLIPPALSMIGDANGGGGEDDAHGEDSSLVRSKLLPKSSTGTTTESPATNNSGQRRTSFYEFAIQNGCATPTPLQQPTPAGSISLARRRRSSVVREKWASKLEFLLAVVGYAVDLGNIWRFPSVCYKHGGGAFLIPYVVMLLVGGLPMFYMELALGQFHRSGCLSIWKKICPMFKGIGYGICFICTFIACFYNAIIAHSVYFFFASIAWDVPWKTCGNDWNTDLCREYVPNFNNDNSTSSHVDESSLINGTVYSTPSQEFYLYKVLEIDNSSGFDDLGGIKPSMAACLFLVFLAVYFALWKGPRSTGKAVWITATAPYVVLTILLIRGLTLPGAGRGISFYLTPDFNRLREPAVWTAAATQIFFSLGPGFGVLLALSSYNDFNSNCYRDAVVTSLINCFTSFFSGFVIFSTLGYMSEITNRPVSEVVGESESSLIFVVYPQAIATMNYSTVWSLIFFLMLITLGIDSTVCLLLIIYLFEGFSGIEALITGFCDEYPRILARKREIFVGVVIISYYIGSLPTVTYGGNFVIPFLDEYGVSLSVLFIVMCEMIAVCWFYGVRRFSNDIRLMLGFYPGLYWRVCWTCCPIFIGLIFALSLYSTSFSPIQLPNYIYPKWSVYVGWVLRLLSCLSVPVFALYLFATTSGTAMQRWKAMITPQQRHPSLSAAAYPPPSYGINPTIVVDDGGGGTHHTIIASNDYNNNNSPYGSESNTYHCQVGDSRTGSIAHL